MRDEGGREGGRESSKCACALTLRLVKSSRLSAHSQLHQSEVGFKVILIAFYLQEGRQLLEVGTLGSYCAQPTSL